MFEKSQASTRGEIEISFGMANGKSRLIRAVMLRVKMKKTADGVIFEGTSARLPCTWCSADLGRCAGIGFKITATKIEAPSPRGRPSLQSEMSRNYHE
jgi:hypothetical protein